MMASPRWASAHRTARRLRRRNLRWPDGGLPINDGRSARYIHGFGNVVEAVRQVRGESTCQVEDVELSLSVSGPGFAPGSAVLFGAA
jgi:hypothetical protein